MLEIVNEVISFDQNNQYISIIVVLVVIATGYFCKKRWPNDLRLFNGKIVINLAWKIFFLSFFLSLAWIISCIYEPMCGLSKFAHLRKFFLSFFLATSLYDLILKTLFTVLDKYLKKIKNKDKDDFGADDEFC